LELINRVFKSKFAIIYNNLIYKLLYIEYNVEKTKKSFIIWLTYVIIIPIFGKINPPIFLSVFNIVLVKEIYFDKFFILFV